MTTISTARALGVRMCAVREERGLSVEAAASQARVGDRTFAAVEEFGERACTTVTHQRILDWLDR
jgi:hypothetical protein